MSVQQNQNTDGIHRQKIQIKVQLKGTTPTGECRHEWLHDTDTGR